MILLWYVTYVLLVIEVGQYFLWLHLQQIEEQLFNRAYNREVKKYIDLLEAG
jgi:hypothetical protein